MSWKDIEDLLSNGHEIGGHTYKHDRVNDLSLDIFKEDFEKTHQKLVKYCGKVEHFAYTYGSFDDCYEEAIEFVYNFGYASCASGVRGCHIKEVYKPEKGNLLLRRDQIIGGWPTSHSLYFIANSSRKASINNHYSPLKKYNERKQEF